MATASPNTCLMASIGHRNGSFDVMVGIAPETSGQITSVARQNEPLRP